MSFENQEQHEKNQRVEARDESQKKFKISYTRDFLLSLRELDICKKLPSGFDQSILSEFEDASQDRFRISGGLSSQSYRCNEYGSSPPTRGDANNYSRGVHLRWDNPSSGRSDRDSDSQSDWDSDSGRRYGNQSRRPWQVPEHDGLLGSGSFPRPAGYATGASGPKFRANDHCHLNRSNEPYHPPRPYKAVPHSRRDTDSYNDETFGSSEYTSEDRAEEERKRRASFELMRKEQQKAFQEKQKLNTEKGKDDFDITELLEDPKDDKRVLNRRNESDGPMIQPASNNVSDKSSFPSPAPVSRPLVPPGFSSTAVEKNIGTKSSTHAQLSEFGNELEGSLFHVKGNRLLSGNSNVQEEKQPLEEIDSREHLLGGPIIHASVNKHSEKILNLSLDSDVSKEAVDKDNHYYETSKLPKPFEASENSEVMELDAKDVKGSKVVGDSNPIHSTSILDKLFSSALTLNGVGLSNITEHDVKADDMLSPHMVQSSKFAQWFLDEEKNPIDDLSSGKPSRPVDDFSYGRPNKPVDELSSGRTVKSVDDFSSDQPNHLLPLIAGGEKGGSSSIVGSEKSESQAFDVKASGNIRPRFPFQGSGLADGQAVPNSMPVTVETIDKLEAVPAVLTCEDLEQSIMSEITENGPVLQPPLQDWSGSAARIEQKTQIDDHASQHLLSLLQKGTGLSTDLGIVSSDRPQNIEVDNFSSTFHSFREMITENISDAGKPLTLETLFGTAFMKELKSVGTPTSGQRVASVSMRVDVSESSFPMMDDDILASTADIGSSMSCHGSSALASNQRQQMTSERIGEQFLGLDPQNEVDLSQRQTEFGSKLGGFDGSAEVRLPEGDSLIAANDPLNPMSGRSLARAELLSSPETAVDIAEKLAALNSSVYRDERAISGGREGPILFRGPCDMREPDVQYHKIHAQSSSPRLHPSQLNHAGSMFHSLDSRPANISAQMKFMAPESIIHRDPPNHQFPANLLCPPFHHPSTVLTGLDSNPHNAMLQQMHIPGNFPAPHLLRGIPRSTPLPPHPNNQVSGFIQEPNPMQGFPFGQKQPNFGGLGVPPQAADVGSGTHHPEALQRLIEMELRSKQVHPFATASRGQGLYGHELDMSFGYR